MKMHSLSYGLCGPLLALCGAGAIAVPPDDLRSYYLFETAQTCAMDLSPQGKGLAVANTPNNTLELFAIAPNGGLFPRGRVKVGLEPSCVKWRSESEVWVVNHLSDSVSIVRIGAGLPKVVQTLKVGDMPYSVEFGGTNRELALIPTKRRDILEKTYDNFTGALDVWVFDTAKVGAGKVAEQPVTVLNYFAEGGVPIAASADGSVLYTAPLRSGNRSTIAPATEVAGDLPEPWTNVDGDPGPAVGLIARPDGEGVYRDGAGRDISAYVKVEVTDNDVCRIDVADGGATAGTCFEGVGTILYSIAVGPDGTVYVANTDADNARRFEGRGEFAGSTVSGRHHLNQITVIKTDGTIVRNWINRHLNLDARPFSDEDRAKSLALLVDIALSDDGQTLYAAAFGSSRIAAFSTDELKNGTATTSPDRQIPVSGGGPNSLVLDAARNRLYALNRFNNSISVIDLTQRAEVSSVALFNPEPEHIVRGRQFLYDAQLTSGPGNVACASCHVFGDTDDLGWDLGDPDASILENLNPFVLQEDGVDIDFHPMKGPMFTQTLKGMRHHGPMHWRGDKSGANVGEEALDEKAAFKQFIGAFEGVLAREEPIDEADMDAFAEFALELMLEPNYYQPIDGVLSPKQKRGETVYFEVPSSVKTGFACNQCHTIDPIKGQFGTAGLSATRARRPDSPALKVAQTALVPDKMSAPETVPIPHPTGTNYRGYFFNHEGSTFTLAAFLRSAQFSFPRGDADRAALTEFLVAVPRSLENTVGQQLTIDSTNVDRPDVRSLLQILEARAIQATPVEVCDLTVSGIVNGEQRGFVMLRNGKYLSDRRSEGLYDRDQMLEIASAQGQGLTYLCVPPGSGQRIGVDEDQDGHFDRDEIDAGSDPSDGDSTPAA